jgi:hypothetical protein
LPVILKRIELIYAGKLFYLTTVEAGRMQIPHHLYNTRENFLYLFQKEDNQKYQNRQAFLK